MKKLIKAPICEIFKSIQGEGPNLGKPTIFIRFFGCNLRCQFDGKQCDTPYAVFKNKDTIMYSVSKLLNKVKDTNIQLITFTGGEPMLYQEFIEEFIKRVSNTGLSFDYEIETNGTIKPIKFIYVNCSFNISVKLKSSYQKNKTYENRRLNIDVLNSFPTIRSCFKYVYVEEDDIKEIIMITKSSNIKTVYLMPQGTTRKEIIKNSIPVVNQCIKHNWIFCPREHVIIWNNKKGV